MRLIFCRPENSSTEIWISHMNSSYTDSCFVDSNTCPITANSNGCSHFKDVTIECSKLETKFFLTNLIVQLLIWRCLFIIFLFFFSCYYSFFKYCHKIILYSWKGRRYLYIFCKNTLLLLFTIWLVSEGVIRLYLNGITSSSYYYGIVQIWYNGQWGNICDDHDYNQYEADVICHQLGYTGASSYSRAGLVRWSNYYVDWSI